MLSFSKKYNIKFNSTDNIFRILSNDKCIKIKDKFKKSELFFVKDTFNFNNTNNFKDIQNYIVISNERGKNQITLYDNQNYTASLNNVFAISKLLLLYGYEVVFSISTKIHEYSYKNIDFYIQYVNNKNYFLTFTDSLPTESVNTIIDLFKNKLNMNLDDKLYFDIIQEKFKCSK